MNLSFLLLRETLKKNQGNSWKKEEGVLFLSEGIKERKLKDSLRREKKGSKAWKQARNSLERLYAMQEMRRIDAELFQTWLKD